MRVLHRRCRLNVDITRLFADDFDGVRQFDLERTRSRRRCDHGLMLDGCGWLRNAGG